MSPRWLGSLLQSRRADQGFSVWSLDGLQSDEGILLTSPAFEEGASIPRRHAGRGVGDNVSPELGFSGVPPAADHLVLIVEDVDVPFEKPLIHSLSLLDPDATSLAEGELRADSPTVEHVKSFGRRGYNGPRPIVGHGEHHYRFMLLAVDGHVDTSSVTAALDSMKGHVVARGKLVGTYER